MIKVFFVRHAQPEHAWENDRTRPLTAEGNSDVKKVLEFFKDKNIDQFYSSPYRRSVDTIAKTANHFCKEIILDERFREREKGKEGNNHGMFQKRWADLNFHEEGGESIAMVQERNIAALKDIITKNIQVSNKADINIVIGTHGTALSSILHYYDSSYSCESFLRIIDWMPYIIELNFDKDQYVDKIEHLHIEKEFKGDARADKK
jgi:2,3-bisphosphoglycerate-dependent phosphoglycerate mutase